MLLIKRYLYLYVQYNNINWLKSCVKP